MTHATLHCPDCGQRIQVDGPMREALVRAGCVVCGTRLSHDDFR